MIIEEFKLTVEELKALKDNYNQLKSVLITQLNEDRFDKAPEIIETLKQVKKQIDEIEGLLVIVAFKIDTRNAMESHLE